MVNMLKLSSLLNFQLNRDTICGNRGKGSIQQTTFGICLIEGRKNKLLGRWTCAKHRKNIIVQCINNWN